MMAVERLEMEEQYLAFIDEVIRLPSEGDEEHRFVVDDDAKADWCLRKLRQVRQRMAQREAFVTAEIERLQAWQIKQDAEDLRSESFFEYQLRDYFERLRAAGALGRRKSYKLPNGTLAVRKAAAKVERDETKLLEWVKANAPDHAVVTERVAWGDLKPRVELVELADGWAAIDRATGEMIPGITVVAPEGETFNVKTEEVEPA
jgi:hypothetical protein